MSPRRIGLARVVAAAACAGVLLSACTEDLDPSDPEPSCGLVDTGRALDGDWTLTGSGRREGCEDRRLEGDLSIHTAMEIAVDAVVQVGGADGGGGGRPEFVLSEANDAPDGVTISGDTSGSCVHFTLTEDLGSDELVYEFDGYITGSSFASGSFQGRGPEECTVSGTFSLDVR